jgi:MFS family permease
MRNSRNTGMDSTDLHSRDALAAGLGPTRPTPPVGGSYVGLLLRNADFRRAYLATLISLAGDWFMLVALYDLVLAQTGSATLISLVNVCLGLPPLLVTPWAGSLIDRLDRRRLMVTVDLLRAGLALLPLLVVSPSLLPLAYVAVAGLSAGSGFFDPAAEAAAPNLVAPEDLGRANALLGSAWGTMLMVGSALGGLVATYLGRNAAFALNALSFLVSALLLLRIKTPFSAERTRSQASSLSLRESLGEALRFSRKNPQVMALLFGKGLLGLVLGMTALLSVFGEKVFLRGSEGISKLFVARGLGALIGPFLLFALVHRPSRRSLMIAPCLMFYSLGYAFLSMSGSLEIALIPVTIGHMGGGAMWQATTFAMQQAVPDELRGRLFAFDQAILAIAYSVSTVCVGMLVDAHGARPVYFVLALVGTGLGLGLFLATRRLWLGSDSDHSESGPASW